MAGCACGDSCKCVVLERKVEQLQEEIDSYRIALDMLSRFEGKKMGLYYGSDGLEKMRSVARSALASE